MSQRPTGAVEPLPLVVLRPGQEPVRQDEPSPALWVVESGVLRACVVAAEGHRLLLDLLGPGDLAGEPDGEPSACTLRAVRPTRLRPVPPARVAAGLAQRAARLTQLACDLAWLDAPGRVERRLDDLAERFGRPVPGGTAIAVRLTQDDLAGLAGTTRETANRAIRALTARGRLTVARRGRYVVRTPLRVVTAPRDRAGWPSSVLR